MCNLLSFLQKQGSSIVMDPEKDKSMVQDLLDFKEQLDSIIEDAFMKSEKFVNSMKVQNTCENAVADLVGARGPTHLMGPTFLGLKVQKCFWAPT